MAAATTLRVNERHAVNGNRIVPPFPEGLQTAVVGMGCFWGAEKEFWQLDGVYSTAAGYAVMAPLAARLATAPLSAVKSST